MSSTPVTPPGTNQFRAPARLPQRFFDQAIVDPKTGKVTREAAEYFTKLSQQKVPTTFVGTHFQRIAAIASAFVDGSVFNESDRGVLYELVNGVWTFYGNPQQTTQDSLPLDLTATDKGYLVSVTDFNHTLQWTGSAWSWFPSDPHSGWIAAFVNAPLDAGWQVCDGSVNVPQLLSDGTLVYVTVPNTPGSYFRQ